jgi:hypothetical protein
VIHDLFSSLSGEPEISQQQATKCRMRLIHTETLRLHEFWGDQIPNYVILSHTWDNEEVTFQDLHDEQATSKKGFVKIKRCCEEAVKIGVEYAWVDTCSIDKTSSSELSEAINSMFRWYRRAIKCYAYLSDLPSGLSSKDLKTRLPACRYFKRGWTLQELLVPKEVIFLAQDWTPMGTRDMWASAISKSTKIHEEALTGDVDRILAFSVAQKFSWASSRVTTREEDMSYCLLGLFNIHMPLLYGEGQQAFIRLQEEIMKRSDDQSLFAWSRAPGDASKDSVYGLLAVSPAQFIGCIDIVPFRNWTSSEPYEMTNAGISMRTSLLQCRDYSGSWFSEKSLILKCYDQKATQRLIGVPLKQLSPKGDQFARMQGLQYHLGNKCEFEPLRTIYIKNEIILPGPHELFSTGEKLSFLIVPDDRGFPFKIKDAWPKSQWDGKFNIVRPPNRSNIMASGSRWSAPDPELFNWGWHVALLLDFEENDVFVTSRDCTELVVVVGYNGRTDQCWITGLPAHDLEDCWTFTRFSGLSEWDDHLKLGYCGSVNTRAVILGTDGSPISDKVTPQWAGRPLQVKIRINN